MTRQTDGQTERGTKSNFRGTMEHTGTGRRSSGRRGKSVSCGEVVASEDKDNYDEGQWTEAWLPVGMHCKYSRH